MSTFTPIDADERVRIQTDLDANLCVEAGAGTGKTTVLVDRIVAVLRTGYATVDEIAVITFTEAAAAELAARVRQQLETALDESTGEERERIHAALTGLHRAHVETIHAFASGLLRERPVEAGLDPGFEVLDELAGQLAFDAAYRAWQDELLAEVRPAVDAAIRRGFNLVQIRRLVETVHAYRSLLPLTPEVAPAGPDAVIAELHQAATACRAHLAYAGSDEIGIADMERIVAYAGTLATVADDEAELDRELLFRAPKLNPGRGRKDDWDDPARCAESKTLRKQVKETLEAAAAALRTQAIVALLPLAEEFVAKYEAERRAAGTADFDDLLEWARDMLATSPEARNYFRRRFRVVLVDEFQDTDPVQADIALCIASDLDPGTDWLELRPRPGSLTVVGDPKQSIYRFRRADIAVYDAIRRGPLAGGEAQLVQNFRSVGGVLAWANRVFDRVLVEQVGVQPANTELRVGQAQLGDESLSVCVVHGESEDTSADGVRTEEARLLATTIRDAIESGWRVRDRETREERAATYGDVVVLLPRRTALDTYLEAFRRAGVDRVRAEGGRSFFQRQEVLDLANVLQAIDDPLDKVALVACLRSTVFACTDEEIFLHRAAGYPFDYRVEAPDSPESVRDGLALLRELHDRRSRVSLAQLVRETLAPTRLVELALAGGDGQQSAANLVKLADRARAFSASGAGGLRAFARWLTEQRASSDEAEANVAEETEDVVRIMTIHASKGLEFPIVALANLGTRPRNDVEPVPDRRAHRLHVRIKNRDDEFKTPGFDEAWEHEKEQKTAEDKRLLYVAVTRARDHLIVPVASEPLKPGPLLFDLLPSLPQWDEATAGTLVDGCHVIDRRTLPALSDDERPLPRGVDEASVETALAERAAWESERVAVIDAARAELAVHPATADEGDNPVPASLAGADDQPLIAGGGESPPRLKGEAMHKALELVDLAHPEQLDEVVPSVCLLAGIEDAADEVLELARACLSSPVVARALAADELWREVPYTRRVEDGYATGRIDLVFREGGALVVADWKSDSIGPSQAEASAEAHRPQAESYATSLAAATGMDVTEVVFVFPRAGASGSISLSREPS
jgi:ATP-dependent helicase/nuclease subunit A